MTCIRWVLNMLKSFFFKREVVYKKRFVFVLAMNKPKIRPDTTMNDYRDPRFDYVTEYEQDQDVPDAIIAPDWLAELRDRIIR